MPVISVEIGKISKEHKIELMRKLTDVAAQVTQIPRQSFIVLINELPDDSIGVGGEVLEEIKKRAGR